MLPSGKYFSNVFPLCRLQYLTTSSFSFLLPVAFFCFSFSCIFYFTNRTISHGSQLSSAFNSDCLVSFFNIKKEVTIFHITFSILGNSKKKIFFLFFSIALDLLRSFCIGILGIFKCNWHCLWRISYLSTFLIKLIDVIF